LLLLYYLRQDHNQGTFLIGPFGFEKLLEAGSLDWSDRFFSNCFWYVSYIVIYICHCFIRLKKILFWNDTWKSVKCRFKKSLRKAILLNPAEVAVDIAYIDSLWVKESNSVRNRNIIAMQCQFLLPLDLPNLSLSSPTEHVPERCKYDREWRKLIKTSIECC
jgi:hypothetical protein